MSRRKRRVTARERLGLLREEWRALTKRDRYLRATYGLTEAQYEKMDTGTCHICERPPKLGKRFHVDHDHKTGRVRGLLDFLCNRRVLGRGRERPELHEAAARYLRRDFDARRI